MAKKTIVTNDGTKGGNLTGKPHKNKRGEDVGGIKAVVTDANNRPVELEGGEVIINKEASKKHWKELSRINQSAGGGVPINKPVDPHDEDPEEYSKGGKIQFNPNKLPNKWILKYAQNIKKNHPEIWKKGGNIYGNQAFKNLERVAERGYWLDSEEWFYIKWRSFVARHKGDFRIAGVVAMLKWVDKVDRGWQYMKNLIEDEIKKIEARKSKKSKGGWSFSRKERMSKGGEVKNKIENILQHIETNNYQWVTIDKYSSVRKNHYGGYTLQTLPKKGSEGDMSYNLRSKEYTDKQYETFKNMVARKLKGETGRINQKFAKGGSTWKEKYNKKYGYKKDTSHDLEEISEDTGVSEKGLQKIYNKGVGARKTNPESVRSLDGKKRGGKSLKGKMSAEQWGQARVYSAVMGGKAAKVDAKELKMGDGGTVEEAMTLDELQTAFYNDNEYRSGRKWTTDSFPKYIEHNGIVFLKGTPKKANGLRKGQYIVSYYRDGNVGTDFWRYIGIGETKDEPYESKDVRPYITRSWETTRECFKELGVRSLSEADKKLDGGLRMFFEFFAEDPDYDGRIADWWYEYENRFARGSGAEIMSFIEYIPLEGDKQETIGGVEREEPVTHELQEKLKEVSMSKSKSGRKSPSKSANSVAPNTIEISDNDGQMYQAKPTKKGYNQWRLLKPSEMAEAAKKLKESEPKTKEFRPQLFGSTYKVGDTGTYNGKKPVPIEITKITGANVYFINQETGEQKRSQKANFERLFVPSELTGGTHTGLSEEELKPTGEFVPTPIEEIEVGDVIEFNTTSDSPRFRATVKEKEIFGKFVKIMEEPYRGAIFELEHLIDIQKIEYLSERKNEAKKPTAKKQPKKEPENKEKPDYYKLFKDNYEVSESGQNEISGMILHSFAEMVDEDRLMSVEKINEFKRAADKIR